MNELSRFGPYQVIREIGRGGFGVVYEAVNTKLDRRVALKVYHAAFAVDAKQRERFKREAQIASHIDHSGVLPVYKIGEQDGCPYLVMPLVDGCSLEQVLERLRGVALKSIRRSTFLAAVRAELEDLPFEEALNQAGPALDIDDPSHAETAAQIAAYAADALAAAHEKGIYHRDVKPANLLLNREGQLFVSDFGLARDETLATLTRTGEFHGTPHYLSPEQTLADRKAVDHRTDVYSLGATLYATLTMVPPHEGSTSTEVVQSIVFKQAPSVTRRNPSIPHDLALIVHKALEVDPADRYWSMDEFAADLRRFLSHEAVRAKSIGSVGRLSRWSQRHARTALLLGLSVIALVVLSAWGVHTLRTQEQVLAAGREEARLDLQRRLGHLRGLIDGNRLVEAITEIDVLRAAYAETEASVDIGREIVAATRERIDSFNGALRPDARSMDRLDALDDLDAIRRLAAAARARLDASEHEAVRAAIARADELRAALALHPSLRDAFAADAERSLDGLAAAVAVGLEAAQQEFRMQVRTGSTAHIWQMGALDFTRVYPSPDDLRVEGQVVFGGYAISDPSTGFDDLRALDLRGRVVLCIRRCPRYEDPEGPFTGNQEVSLFARKAQLVQEAGAVGLLIANRLEEGIEGGLVASPGVRPPGLVIPVLSVSHGLANSLLVGAGETIATLQAAIDADGQPRSFQLDEMELSLGFDVRDQETSALLASLLPALLADGVQRQEARLEPWIASQPLLLRPGLRCASRELLLAPPAQLVAGMEPTRTQLLLALASVTPGALADEVLVSGLQGRPGDVRMVGLLTAERPRPQVLRELRAAYSRLVDRDPLRTSSRWGLELPLRAPVLSREDYQRPDRVASILRFPGFTIHDDILDIGHLLAAIWIVDETLGESLARASLSHWSCVAVMILVRENPRDLRDLLNFALEQSVSSDPHSGGKVDYSLSNSGRGDQAEQFRAICATQLAKLGDLRALSHLEALLARGEASKVWADLEAVVEAVQLYPPPAGAEVLLDLYLTRASDRSLPREEARVALLDRGRFTAVEDRLLEILADEHDPRLVDVLALLDHPEAPDHAGEALTARLIELSMSEHPALRRQIRFFRLPAVRPSLEDLDAMLASGKRSNRTTVLEELVRYLDENPAVADPELLSRLFDQVVQEEAKGARESRWRGAATRALQAEGRTAWARTRAFETLRSLSLPTAVRARALAFLPTMEEVDRETIVTLLGDAQARAVTVAWLFGGNAGPRVLQGDFWTVLLQGERVPVDVVRIALSRGRWRGFGDWSEDRRAAGLSFVQVFPEDLPPELGTSANSIAWALVNPDDPVPAGAEIGLALAEIAVRLTPDAACLDTLACACAMTGDLQRAIELQVVAVRRIGSNGDPSYQAHLELFRERNASESSEDEDGD